MVRSGAGLLALGLLSSLALAHLAHLAGPASVSTAGDASVNGLVSPRLVTAEAAPGPVDVGFAQAMWQHHRQAVAMAQLLRDGRPTGLDRLAHGIEADQLLELGQMQGWLMLWQQPLLPPSRGMYWLLAGRTPPDDALRRYLLDCQRSPTGMPGMASFAELEHLRRLAGRARDRLFLELMIRHHRGGLPMAVFAAGNARLGPVRDLAGRIVLEQAQELALMERTQQVLGPAPTPHSPRNNNP